MRAALLLPLLLAGCDLSMTRQAKHQAQGGAALWPGGPAASDGVPAGTVAQDQPLRDASFAEPPHVTPELLEQGQEQYRIFCTPGHAEDGRGQGRVVSVAGAVPDEGYFIAPTIVRDLPSAARLVREEQFGPVLPVLAYDDLDEAIARINDSPYGLGGSVWTRDVERGLAAAARIESGTVWVNKAIDLPFDVPVGGAKQSGMGRQQGIEALEEFTQARVVNAAL